MRTAVIVLLLLMALIVLTACQEGFAPYGGDKTIFVNVSAYRDTECSATVKDAFAKASKPERVYVGICQQNKESAEDCLGLPGIDMTHVKSLSLDYSRAKGPTYARYLTNTLYAGEDFMLQIDSHTRFVDGWDSKLILMLEKCPSRKAVLTHYPHAYEVKQANVPADMKTHVPVMCRSKWNSDGIPTFEAVLKPVDQAGLRRVPFLAGGMIFGPGRLFQEVRLDPGLDYLFVGEEVLLSARLFTHGWDLFTPSENVVLHHYERKDGPRFWQDITGYRAQQMKTLNRVKSLLGLQNPDISLSDEYGMGSERTMEKFWGFCRLNPGKRTSDSADFFCRD